MGEEEEFNLFQKTGYSALFRVGINVQKHHAFITVYQQTSNVSTNRISVLKNMERARCGGGHY